MPHFTNNYKNSASSLGDSSTSFHYGDRLHHSNSTEVKLENDSHATNAWVENPHVSTASLAKAKGSVGDIDAKAIGKSSAEHEDDIVGLSSSSSLVSLADSTFSSIISGSSQSSIGNAQARTEQFSKLVFEDDIIQPTCFAIVGIISVDRFEKELRRLLRSFSAKLLQDATNIREKQAGKFVKLRSRNAAHLICDELNASKRKFKHKQKQTAAPRIWEPWSESEVSEDEDGMADIQDLGAFVLQSNAFEGLRNELLWFLTWQLFEPMPFPDLELVASVQEICSRKFPPKVDIRGPSWLLSAAKRMWYRGPKLGYGMKRVHWKCGCGSSINDIYEELEPGAAKDFERQLRKLQRTQKTQRGRFAENGHAIIQYFVSLPGALCMLVATVRAGHRKSAESDLPSFETRQQPENPHTPISSLANQKLFILLCVNNGIGSSRTGLKQPTVHNVDSDRQLFSVLSEKYFGSRHKWWSFLSLWSLRDIFFVHFEMYSEAHVDIRERDTVPSSNNEYLHEKCILKPPVGSNTLKHFLECPSSAPLKPPCLNRIPKRMRDPLTACPEKGLSPGWGLEFAEGWDTKKILTLTYVSFLAGCMIALILCLWKKYSVQDSVAISTLVFAIYAGGVAVFQASKYMT